jgi:hypothetical protein
VTDCPLVPSQPWRQGRKARAHRQEEEKRRLTALDVLEEEVFRDDPWAVARTSKLLKLPPYPGEEDVAPAPVAADWGCAGPGAAGRPGSARKRPLSAPAHRARPMAMASPSPRSGWRSSPSMRRPYSGGSAGLYRLAEQPRRRSTADPVPHAWAAAATGGTGATGTAGGATGGPPPDSTRSTHWLSGSYTIASGTGGELMWTGQHGLTGLEPELLYVIDRNQDLGTQLEEAGRQFTFQGFLSLYHAHLSRSPECQKAYYQSLRKVGFMKKARGAGATPSPKPAIPKAKKPSLQKKPEDPHQIKWPLRRVSAKFRDPRRRQSVKEEVKATPDPSPKEETKAAPASEPEAPTRLLDAFFVTPRNFNLPEEILKTSLRTLVTMPEDEPLVSGPRSEGPERRRQDSSPSPLQPQREPLQPQQSSPDVPLRVSSTEEHPPSQRQEHPEANERHHPHKHKPQRPHSDIGSVEGSASASYQDDFEADDEDDE